MTTKVVKFTKDGRKILPVVKLGNERLFNDSGSFIAGGKFVSCEEHGTVPRVYVKKGPVIALCCRDCVQDHCTITKAVLRPNWTKDVDDIRPVGSSS